MGVRVRVTVSVTGLVRVTVNASFRVEMSLRDRGGKSVCVMMGSPRYVRIHAHICEL